MFATKSFFSYNTLGDKMKVLNYNDKSVVIFLPTPNLLLETLSKEELEDYFRSLFLKLGNRYEINQNGFYQITIYKDAFFGSILEIEEEEIPYFDYMDTQVEMSIHIKKDSFFMYEVADILDLEEEIIKKSNLYFVQNKFYIELKSKIMEKNYMKLLEYGKIIYGEKVKKVQKYGKLLDKCLCE